MMKLIIAIVQKKDASVLSAELIKNDFGATKLATTGGFLREGNTTFLISVEEERLTEALHIIKQCSHEREENYTAPSFNPEMSMSLISRPVEVTVGGATVFVLDVSQFKRF